jgi:hypothetical protein
MSVIRTASETKIIGTPKLAEWIAVILIWIFFGFYIHFNDATIAFMIFYIFLLVPVMALAFFQEYLIRDGKLYYRPAVKKLLGKAPKEIDLSKPFKIKVDRTNSTAISSDAVIMASSFIPFRTYHIYSGDDVLLAPIVGKATLELIPVLSRFEGYQAKETVDPL